MKFGDSIKNPSLDSNEKYDQKKFLHEYIQNPEFQHLLQKIQMDQAIFEKWLRNVKFNARLFNDNNTPSPDPHLVASFNQHDVIKQLNDEENFQTLNKINKQYNGLCEIISNFVITKDLLGHDHSLAASNQQSIYPTNNFLKSNIRLDNINQKEIRHSHILKTTNIFAKLLAIFFDIYPNSIIPNFTKILQKTNDKSEVNKDALLSSLDKMPNDSYIKFLVFKQEGFHFNGHSMVIKKNSNNTFCFFDPDVGEYQNLSFDLLCEKINQNIQALNGSSIAFIDAKKYIHDLGIDNLKKNKPSSP